MCVNLLGLQRRCFVVSLALPHPDPILPQIREVPLAVGNQVSEQDVTHGEAAHLVPESMSCFRRSKEVLLPVH